jgi:hypothetical protein
MKNLIPYLVLFIFCACSKSDPEIQYPRTYEFDKYEYVHHKVGVLNSNFGLDEINRYTGSYAYLTESQIQSIYQEFIIGGVYLKEITLLSKDSVELTISEMGELTTGRIAGDFLSKDSVDLDQFKFYWKNDYSEFRGCTNIILPIPLSGPVFWSFNTCTSTDINEEIKSSISEFNLIKGDSLGVYFYDMVYKLK